MTTCSRCGKVLAPESIHTCSPQVVEDFPDARLPDVPGISASGWLTRPPHEAPWQADDQEAWYGEALAQREARQQTREQLDALVARYDAQIRALESRAVAAEEQVAALRRLAEETAAAIDVWCTHPGCKFTAPPRCQVARDFLDRLAEIGGAS